MFLYIFRIYCLDCFNLLLIYITLIPSQLLMDTEGVDVEFTDDGV